ncbi:MAG: hypothetical protein U5N85_13350 [Arcicella sp.]|nr:hypothetical protein [Arcicella sp.]
MILTQPIREHPINKVPMTSIKLPKVEITFGKLPRDLLPESYFYFREVHTRSGYV